MNYDTIVVSGEKYNIHTLYRLPACLDPRKIATPCKNGITAFFTSASPLSNHFVCKIKMPEGIIYESSEHGFFHKCAIELNDEVQAVRILNARTPSIAKSEGMKIRGIKESDLYSNDGVKVRDIMYKICKLKFSQTQNVELLKFLLATKDTKLAEGNPNDQRWGVGLKVNGPDIFIQDKWIGQNWLGGILERIRDELKDATSVKSVD